MPPIARVLSGLRLSSIGVWAVASAAALLLSLMLLSQVTSRSTYYFNASQTDRIIVEARCQLALVAAGVGVIGLLIGYVGRRHCMSVPGTVASARIRLALVFEVCSLLSATAFVGVSSFTRLQPFVEFTWVVFSCMTAYIARMKHLQFAHSLAEAIAPALVPEVTAVQRLYLYVPGGFIMAVGMVPTGNSLASFTRNDAFEAGGVIFAWLTATAAAVFGVILVWRWTAMLTNLRTAVSQCERLEPELNAEDDPDREYRERYRRGELAEDD